MRYEIVLPALFYDDHSDRMSDKDPSVPAYSDKIVARKGRLVVVDVCDEALEEIESDADYYASMRPGRDIDSEYASVVRSAKVAMRRIAEFRKQAQG